MLSPFLTACPTLASTLYTLPGTEAVTFTAPEVEEEEEDLTDDLELVAVITAAIAASENTSGDGFVVRSIKKANKRNWQRA